MRLVHAGRPAPVREEQPGLAPAKVLGMVRVRAAARARDPVTARGLGPAWAPVRDLGKVQALVPVRGRAAERELGAALDGERLKESPFKGASGLMAFRRGRVARERGQRFPMLRIHRQAPTA